MRACEGCRKRKIKCDGATTSSWPCGSCTRLKQKCNPPVVNLDRATPGGGPLAGLERVLNFDEESGSGDDEEYLYGANGAFYDDFGPTDSLNVPQAPYGAGLGPFSTPPFTDGRLGQQGLPFQSAPSAFQASSFQDQTNFFPSNASVAPSDNSNWSSEHYNQPPSDLSDALGGLKINDNGVGELPLKSFSQCRC